MNVGIKGWLHWAAGYGVSRATLKLLARHGDPLSQLVIDTSQPDNVYQLVEEIRLRGRISSFPGGGLTRKSSAKSCETTGSGPSNRGIGHRFVLGGGSWPRPIRMC
jgi:hypothetical protein